MPDGSLSTSCYCEPVALPPGVYVPPGNGAPVVIPANVPIPADDTAKPAPVNNQGGSVIVAVNPANNPYNAPGNAGSAQGDSSGSQPGTVQGQGLVPETDKGTG